MTSYYEVFHKSVPLIEHSELLESIPRLIDDVDLLSLDAILGVVEIKRAMWDLDPESSPDPDGYPGSFFRCCWEIIAADNIWRERNDRRHGGPSMTVSNIFARIKHDVQDRNFVLQGMIRQLTDLLCCHQLGLNALPKKDYSMLEVIWYKPIWGWTKLNVEGCPLGNPGRAGAGGVLRDHRDSPVEALKKYLGVHSNYFAEFRVLLEGIMVAKYLNMNALWIESDLAAVVMAVQAHTIPWYACQDWISCQDFLASISWKITHCFREANAVADFLAGEAAKTGESSLNVSFPVHIISEIAHDADSGPRFRLMF
ncbi:uncharacterized protein LOC122066439 [Macadamia integrifolia]|uniref:uncharacterized protein LOC122066439 n=1 Tax=Macadamia integrifolia TaxID=60698 RepID=UPI001C4EB5DB|nr:uncharacterized protein LOC122066439 [Macadamia integrifolia]